MGAVDVRKTGLILFMAVLVVVIVVATLWMRRAPETPVVAFSFTETLARIGAAEVARVMDYSGRIVLLNHDAGAFPDAARREKAFTAAARENGLDVRAVEVVRIEDVPPDFDLYELGIPASLYVDIAARHAEADLIVSLAGPPILSAGDPRLDPGGGPGLAVIGSGPFGLRRLFNEGVLQLAIVAREDVDTERALTIENPREWFEASFQVITPENAHRLPH